ncbi:MAG: hypothetical protein EOO06_19200 [Chitinophagaceae bacterium]|nr:MAG: hypothetical protein EOO06_19200 [Chitinophagaceae bacterium]
MSELVRIKTKIEATEAKLQKAEDEKMPVEYLTSLQNHLASLQNTMANLISLQAEEKKKENLLSAPSVPTPGKSPSNKL